MHPNRVKQVLREGGTAVGTMMFEFGTPGIARVAAAAGADFALFDMEHTAWGLSTIKMLLAGARASEIVPMVRVPTARYEYIAGVLDAGAMGVMVPMVSSPEQAAELVSWCRYPPAGRRGTAFGIAHDDYRGGDVVEKMLSANRELLIIAQIETRSGLESVEEIAAVDGIDVLWIGQFDLTTSLGIAGCFDHADFHGAIERVAAAARRHGKAAGYMTTDLDEAARMIQRGFRCLAWSGDVWIYQQALRSGLEGVRAATGSAK
ncbi:MAG: aldolase [Planctomycetes bacterium]|nr:aldolase [Planctomycetota bacterium]